jgi:serine-type D-Ala-D-Ala endopeptidase (penicillin-binding protein 7)
VEVPGFKRLLSAAALATAVAIAMPGTVLADGGKSKSTHDPLRSSSVLVLDQGSGEVIYGKNAHAVVPIASITKVMTAMVVLDAQLDPQELISVTDEDVDWLRGSSSRLPVGTTLTRDQMLQLALMASENRAAYALSRAYPGGRTAFVAAMNEKARSLGLQGTRFADPTGLSSTNVSTAEDLATLVASAHTYPTIREYSTRTGLEMQIGKRIVAFRNTNRLVSNPSWEIGLSKTGFINEAGRCLVMQAQLAGRAVIMVLLDSWGTQSRLADAMRIRQWVEAAAGIKPAPSLKPVAHKASKKTRGQLTASRAHQRGV